MLGLYLVTNQFAGNLLDVAELTSFLAVHARIHPVSSEMLEIAGFERDDISSIGERLAPFMRVRGLAKRLLFGQHHFSGTLQILWPGCLFSVGLEHF